MPIPLILLLIVIGALLMRGRARSLGVMLCASAVIGLYALSISPVARSIASPLEFAHPKYAGQPVQYVVVLGAGHSTDARASEIGQLNRTALFRLTTGIDIYRQNPGAKLLLSGWGAQDPKSHAEVSKAVAIRLGVNPEDIKVAPDARVTAEEADAWRYVLLDKPFALVTSALHLPRAMNIFETKGMNPIPAPANFESGADRPLYWRDWIPQAGDLALSQAAWHEYLGITWFNLKQLWSEG